MKGIIIFEDANPTLKNVYCINLNNSDVTMDICSEAVYTLTGVRDGMKTAACNKDDTYDFKVGVLIALMKMCGKDKVTKACDELYKDDKYKNTLQEMTENNEKLMEELKELKKDSDKIIDELIEENEKLKLDCEKLQHGYNDMIFCGGRQNGKQYTALVNMFKKLDQKKVDAAYKEAYQIKDFSEEINYLTVDSLIEQSRAFTRKCVNEWLYKIPTKREEMWTNILNASQDPPVDIKVAKQDIKAFLKELQVHIPKARMITLRLWNGSDCLVTEYTNPYWFNHDYIYFALFRYDDKANLKICYDENKHNWIDKPVIEYIAPMRWDLFKKGRLAVKVTYENYKGFYDACERELGKKPATIYCGDFTVSICKKDGKFEIFDIKDQKSTGRKIVNWEDVK